MSATGFRPWEKGMPALAAVLRPEVPGIAGEAAAEIVRRVPDYGRRRGALEDAAERALAHFVGLIADPGASWDGVLALFRELGAAEAREGRTLEVWRSAARMTTRVAIRRLTELSVTLRLDVSTSLYGQVTGSVFGYLDVLAGAVAEGYAGEVARRPEPGRRGRLVDLLLRGETGGLARQAAEAGWTPPVTAAAAVLRGPRAGLPELCLESGFNATEVAGRLGLHAQTVRYRLRKLEELFGTRMYEPAGRLELEIALHAWLALHDHAGEPEPSARVGR